MEEVEKEIECKNWLKNKNLEYFKVKKWFLNLNLTYMKLIVNEILLDVKNVMSQLIKMK